MCIAQIMTRYNITIYYGIVDVFKIFKYNLISKSEINQEGKAPIKEKTLKILFRIFMFMELQKLWIRETVNPDFNSPASKKCCKLSR